jgi:nickel-type superoxide dismutase maturation protease
MGPTLRHGDVVVVLWGARPNPGAVVVARRPDRPDLTIVKRVRRIRPDGAVWLEGDLGIASDDSRLFGAVPADHVLGRVVARLRRGRPRLVR